MPEVAFARIITKKPLSGHLLDQNFFRLPRPIRVGTEAEITDGASMGRAAGDQLVTPAHTLEAMPPYNLN